MELRESMELVDVLRAYPTIPPELAPLVLDGVGHYLHDGDPVRIRTLPPSPATRGHVAGVSASNAPGRPVLVVVSFLDGSEQDWPASAVEREWPKVPTAH